jgi:putative tryptophan/tyrosine transport system substrate-binding protein
VGALPILANSVPGRRNFLLALLAAVLLGRQAAGQAAQVRSARIGILSDRTPDAAESALLAAFRETLRDHGWSEGRNLAILARYSGDDPARLPAMAARLVREAPDLIFATTLPAALAAKKATATIPIVFNVLPDPVEQGLVAALARPGGNVTGVAVNSSRLIPKRLQLLKEAMPGLARVAVLVDANQDEACEAAWDALRDPARTMGIAIDKVVADAGYARAFDAMRRARVQAVLVPATTRFYNEAGRIAKLAGEHRLAFLPTVGDVAEEHVLLSYGPLQSDAYRHAAIYADRILRGAAPERLPVEQPTRYELVLNLRVAAALAVDFPLALRARADRILD